MENPVEITEDLTTSQFVTGILYLSDFSSCIASSTIFSRLDLQKGCYKIPLASEDPKEL